MTTTYTRIREAMRYLEQDYLRYARKRHREGAPITQKPTGCWWGAFNRLEAAGMVWWRKRRPYGQVLVIRPYARAVTNVPKGAK